MNDDIDIKTVAAVERAFSVLEAFEVGIDSLSLTQLADRTGLYKSTVLRIAQTLERLNYLFKTSDGNYHVGPAPLRLSRLYQAAVKPEKIIVPILKELVDLTRESAGFHIRVQESRFCLYRVDSPKPIRDHFRPGDVLPLANGAGGQMLSAFRKPYPSALKQVRNRMICVSKGAIAKEMGGVAAPVFNAENDIEGVITLSGIASEYTPQSVDRFSYLLLKSALQITFALGGDTFRFDEELQKMVQKQTNASGLRKKSNLIHI